MEDNFYKDVEIALQRIQKIIRKTPLQFSPSLSEESEAEVFLKLENYQVTGSFKARGASNKLMLLSEENTKRIITASSGNHGSAVAYAAGILNLDTLIFLPENVSPAKLNKIKYLGADFKIEGETSGDAETAGRLYAEKHNLPFLSPYNDYDVIVGQGTTAAEAYKQMKSIDVVLVCVGGGGLISGIGGYLKQKNPNTKVIACSPSHSAAMHYALQAGYIIDINHLDTLSDGSAGALERGSITFDYCQSIVDQSILLSEIEIASAMKSFMDSHQMMIEGAAGTAIAGFIKLKEHLKGKRVLIIICGANISMDKMKEIIA